MTRSSLRTGSLQIDFVWQHDRWTHQLVSADDPAGVLLRSCEGTDRDDWPHSPAMQSLHLEGGTAFLVGATTSAHWSASIEADQQQDAIVFDVACRLRAQPERLGSTYQIEPLRAQELQVEILALPAGDSSTCSVAAASETISIVAVSPTAPLPQTARWRYLIRRTR